MKHRMRDVVVVLPGILGSVLQHGGRDLWSPTRRAVIGVATRPRRFVSRLTRPASDAGNTGEVVATALMPDAALVGGLVKIDGYTRLLNAISQAFQVERVTAGTPRPANLIEFPYDWRQDNRLTARRLAEELPEALDRWREFADAPDARLILVAHSMGGLAARYWLEVLGGREYCRELITLGTPFRGSLDAVGYLANGYKKLHVDLTAAMRSCPSVYQLLPVYPAVRTAAGYRRPAEIPTPRHLDAALVADGLAFHREIEDAVAKNAGDLAYQLLPIVGTHQPTFQSAVLEGGELTITRSQPDGVDRYIDDGQTDGDGTVPMASAVPIDLSETVTDIHHPEQHSSLQSNGPLLQQLILRLIRMQSGERLRRLRGDGEPVVPAGQSALTLYMDDEFEPGELVEVCARVSAPVRPEAVVAEVESITDRATRVHPLTLRGDTWRAALPDVEPGTHRIRVTAHGAGLPPVTTRDVFAVTA